MINKLLIPKAYVEVLEIIKYIPEEDYNKIPSEIIENMEINKDKDYKYIVTHFDDFQEQEMLKETETILAVFFRDYWATEEQRKRILEKENRELNILEEEKRKVYNPDDLFKNKKINIINNNKEKENLEISVYKESFFKKLINKIKVIFNIK